MSDCTAEEYDEFFKNLKNLNIALIPFVNGNFINKRSLNYLLDEFGFEVLFGAEVEHFEKQVVVDGYVTETLEIQIKYEADLPSGVASWCKEDKGFCGDVLS